ncbi:hypothetical protein [Streptomyces sp. NPDC056227]|uniref:hypothetical protein n=1 Tax=Streptomyces sp. NPDC056227 TaxID=3345753 RepID=UPI0035DC3FDE
MERNDQLALRLLAELQRLAGLAPGTENAARVTIRSATGEYLGEAPLTQRAADALTDAVSAFADYAEAMPADFEAGTQAPTADGTDIDPLLAAELEEHCIGLDTEYLMSVATQDPRKAVDEFDEITREGEL